MNFTDYLLQYTAYSCLTQQPEKNMMFSKLPLRTSVSPFLRTRPLQDISGKRKHAVLAAKSAKNVVNIVEVGPRDGLQNEKGSIPVEIKVELINRLVRAGVMNVEAGSFVRPEWVPQVCISHKLYYLTPSKRIS